MTPPTPDNEPVSVLRVIEFALAVAVLAVVAGVWVYGWLRGGMLASMFYGG